MNVFILSMAVVCLQQLVKANNCGYCKLPYSEHFKLHMPMDGRLNIIIEVSDAQSCSVQCCLNPECQFFELTKINDSISSCAIFKGGCYWGPQDQDPNDVPHSAYKKNDLATLTEQICTSCSLIPHVNGNTNCSSCKLVPEMDICESKYGEYCEGIVDLNDLKTCET